MPHVKVIVRCRPLLPHEGGMTTARIETNEISNTVAVSSTKSETAKSFAFDRVLPESASQEDVFDSLSSFADHALDGLHSTIFAYGQTGSGKTHTMEGFEYVIDNSGRPRPRMDTPPQRHGILPRMVQAIFDRSRDRMANNPHIRYRLKCSFMQLYNERVSDLLNPATRSAKEGLKIRWTRNDHFEVENLFVFECDNADQMREMFQMGVKEKVMGSHHMNLQSSRSHCIFTIHVESWDPSSPECVVKSDMSLVDLAGSEKLALLSANPSPQLLKESIEINTSLLSLGKVITALAANAKSLNHVPYRDSKLTRLLKHALGGNSMTAMVACIAPLDTYVEETLSTLLYAGRARNITNIPKVNEDPRAQLIRQLREEIASLKAELEYYRQLNANGDMDAKIQQRFMGSTVSPKNANSSNSNAIAGRPRSSDDAALMSPREVGNAPSSAPSTIMVDEAQADLAEKLLASCKMLKNVMAVNNQLRAAFDKLKVARDEASQREVELNAENIALRERIEMLESIALSDEGAHGSPSPKTHPSHAPQQVASSRTQAVHPPPPPQRNHDGDLLSAYSSSNAMRQLASEVAPVRASNQYTTSESLPQRGGFQDRLKDYTSKYRNPQKPTRYEDYYGAAKKVVAPAAAQTQTVVQELDRLLKNAPKSTQQTIPTSLQSSQAFGSLAFGGSEEETKDLEERRRQRKLRLQQMQEQHNMMQRGFSGGAVGPIGGALPTQSMAAPDPPVFGGVSRSAPMLDFGPSSGNAAGGGSGKLFAYLSQEETSKTFTAEQQEKLRMRMQPSQTSSGTSSAHGPGMQTFPATNGFNGSFQRGQSSPRDTPPSISQLQRQLEQIEMMRKR